MIKEPMTKKQAQELLIQNGQLVADTLRHLADNEIDSDYFAIMSTSENGTEIEHELVITDYALQAASTVDALVEALESAQRTIAELDDKCASHLKDARMFREAHDSASEIIRRLESKTLVVTMPTTKYQWGGGVLNTIDPADMIDALRKACAAAGIKCEVKGE